MNDKQLLGTNTFIESKPLVITKTLISHLVIINSNLLMVYQFVKNCK